MTFCKYFYEEHDGETARQEYIRSLRMFLAFKLFSQGHLRKLTWKKIEPGPFTFFFFVSSSLTLTTSFLLLHILFLLHLFFVFFPSKRNLPRAEKADTRSMFQSAALGASRWCRIWASVSETSQHFITETRAWLGDNMGHGASKNHWVEVLTDWLVWFGITRPRTLFWRRDASGAQITLATVFFLKGRRSPGVERTEAERLMRHDKHLPNDSWVPIIDPNLSWELSVIPFIWWDTNPNSSISYTPPPLPSSSSWQSLSKEKLQACWPYTVTSLWYLCITNTRYVNM